MKFLLKGARNIIHVISKYGMRVAAKALSNYKGAYFRKLRVSLPVEIQIEPSSACNLHCRMCGLDKGIRKALLDPTQFELILDMLGTMKGINLTGMGEGLLNRDLEILIKLAGQRGIDVGLVTNGLLLTEERVQTLISTPLRHISVSIESALPEVYEKIRIGGTLETLRENLEGLDKAVTAQKSGLLIYLNTVLIRELLDNDKNIRSVIDLAARYRSIAGITVQNVHDIFSQNTASLYQSHCDGARSFLDRIRSYAEEKKVHIELPQPVIKESSCFYPWVYPYITVFGDVLPCCILPQFDKYSEIIKKYSFGNIFADPFEEIWNGAKAMSFRKELKSDPIPFCRQCSKYLNIL